MKTVILTVASTLFVAAAAFGQPPSRSLLNEPVKPGTQVASSGTQPCRQELQQQRQDIQRLIDRLERGEKLDASAIERALRDASR